MTGQSIKDEPDVFRIPPEYLEMVWPQAKTFLLKSDFWCGGILAREPLDSMFDRIKQDLMQLWVWKDQDNHMLGAALTELQDFPRGRNCNIYRLGGHKMSLWKDIATRTVEAWAKAEKCKTVTISGRLGWERVMAPAGYKKITVTLEKEIV